MSKTCEENKSNKKLSYHDRLIEINNYVSEVEQYGYECFDFYQLLETVQGILERYFEIMTFINRTECFEDENGNEVYKDDLEKMKKALRLVQMLIEFIHAISLVEGSKSFKEFVSEDDYIDLDDIEFQRERLEDLLKNY